MRQISANATILLKYEKNDWQVAVKVAFYPQPTDEEMPKVNDKMVVHVNKGVDLCVLKLKEMQKTVNKILTGNKQKELNPHQVEFVMSKLNSSKLKLVKIGPETFKGIYKFKFKV
jgi:hypothetical protein